MRWLALAYGLLWLAFFVLALFAHFNAYFVWDLQWEIAWQAATLPGLAQVMRALTWLGDGWHAGVAVALVASALIFSNRIVDAGALTASAAGGQFFNVLVKFLVNRPRPAATGIHAMRHLNTLSFPSGHVVHFMACYGFLFALVFLRWERSVWRIAVLIVLGVLLLGIGLSRVYVGEHWPSDVIGGYLVGLCWLGIAIPLYRRWRASGLQQRPMRLSP
jgi:undecaprenyl-diphosphatase